ncbi:hypothetical protein ASJ79_14315 [Mycobacterium sp. NAZ190054]|nr:hypothetical protein ASJ79_14315 [Mycobacterium sp. NAZ190054]
MSTLDVRRALRAHRDGFGAVLDVAYESLRDTDPTGASLATVAERCGLSTAALRTEFPTENALIAGVYLRRLKAAPLDIDESADAVDRLLAQVHVVATLFVHAPQIGVTCINALMRTDDEAVVPVRLAISAEIRRRIAAALGSGAWPEVSDTVETLVSGALLQVGAGMLSYRRMTTHLDTMLRLLLAEA